MKYLNTFNETFKFRQVSKPHSDELYLLLNFAGGDADTEHPEWVKFSKDVKFSNYQNHMFEIDRIIDDYKELQKALDCNSRDSCESYDEVRQKFGGDIAKLYDNAPNDPQSDYANKCYLSSMELVGYDAAGAEHRAYIS